MESEFYAILATVRRHHALHSLATIRASLMTSLDVAAGDLPSQRRRGAHLASV